MTNNGRGTTGGTTGVTGGVDGQICDERVRKGLNDERPVPQRGIGIGANSASHENWALVLGREQKELSSGRRRRRGTQKTFHWREGEVWKIKAGDWKDEKEYTREEGLFSKITKEERERGKNLKCINRRPKAGISTYIARAPIGQASRLFSS